MTKERQNGFLRSFFKSQKKNEQTFQKNDRKKVSLILLDYYKSFMKNHPDIILLFSLDGEILAHNKQSVGEIFGYKLKQKVAYKKHVSTDHYDMLVSSFNRAKIGISERIQFEILTIQRETRFFEGTFIPIENDKQYIEAISLILKDVTQEVLIEKDYQLKTKHLEQVQNIARIGSWTYEIATTKIQCSPSCYTISGLDPTTKPTIGQIFSIIHPEDHQHLIELLNNAITKGESFTTKFRIHHPVTREVRFIQTEVKVVISNRQPTELIGVIKDFSEQKSLEKELKSTNESYRYIFDHLKEGFWMWDVNKEKLTFASKGLAKILQIPLHKLYHQNIFWENIILDEYIDQFHEKNKRLSLGETIEQHYRIEAGDGTTKWIHEQTIPKFDKSGKISHYIGRLIDISREMELRNKLEFLATYDQITSLPNNYTLQQKLDSLLADETIKNFALFYIDIDDFYWIINHLGRQKANKVIQRVANRLIKLHPKNSFIAKEAGDAFVLIVHNYETSDIIYALAETIIQEIGKKIKMDGYEFHITASIGISFFPENGHEKLMLMENAHMALYHAKNLGKNNYQIYSYDRDISAHKKYILEKDLRQAITDEQFEVYYQPQVNSQTNAIVGAEALLRWNHPEWGIVSPGWFIPIAEDKHLIHQIGDWVINDVCKQLDQWRKQGYMLCPISINVSPVRFLKKGIIDTIKQALQFYNIPAKYIKLEVTEGALLQQDQYIIDTLQEIKKLGVKIALDDFGTGYSTFQYLQTFDFDMIKIDQSFVRKLFIDHKIESREAAIVSSFLHLANDLNMEVVAEGVEEFEQLQFLSQKQCDIIQGFIYSKPVPVQQFERLLKKGYLKPQAQKRVIKPKKERRRYYRFPFPSHVPAKMHIIALNKQKVNIGYSTILMENISLGGIRFLSNLRLPVVSG